MRVVETFRAVLGSVYWRSANAARWPAAARKESFLCLPGTYSSARATRLGTVPGYYQAVPLKRDWGLWCAPAIGSDGSGKVWVREDAVVFFEPTLVRKESRNSATNLNDQQPVKDIAFTNGV
jgi:hypothetical protein